MAYLLYPYLAIAPGTIWLLFYLRKDAHPESNKMILKTFFFGMAATFPAALIELTVERHLPQYALHPIVASMIYLFFGVALVEEAFKYFAAKQSALDTSQIDEPLDIMLYMIIAALGFATLENLLYLWPGSGNLNISKSVIISLYRFIGATFLHALGSGTFGYFLARASWSPKGKFRLIATGFILVTVLHGFFNFSIMELSGWLRVGIPLGILIGLSLFVSWGFQKVKRMPHACKTS